MRLSVLTRVSVVLVLLSLVTACMTYDPYTGEKKVSKTTSGAGIGAVAGAVLGAAVSHDKGKGALAGAAIGGAVGAGVGNYMDRQEAELRQQLEGTGVRVQREGNNLRLIMPGNITFDVDQYNIKPQFQPVLDSVATVLKKFDQTAIKVRGYTDSTGSFEYNQQLSERRANAVRVYLMERGIPAGRLQAEGFGPRNPIATNDSAAGREQNRRVELELIPLQ